MGAETAAANAEAGKLERDIGEIQASVAQSKIALQSRKERLEVEYVMILFPLEDSRLMRVWNCRYADVMRKTEHLKEETKNKISFECNQMVNFKRDVTKLLEDLVLFARDN